MIDFPFEMREIFLEFFSTDWKASYFIADQKGKLLQWGGDLAYFGVENMSTGDMAEDHINALFGLLNPSTVPNNENVFVEHVRLDKKIYADILIVHKENQYITFLKDSSEKAVQIFEVQQSRNNLKILVEALATSVESQKKMRSTFLSGFANISHEIKNSLTALQGTFQEMKVEQSATKQKEWVKIGEGAMRHLQGLVYQTMDFSKLESGKQTLNLTPVLVSDFFAKLHSALTPIAKRKDLNLKFETFFDSVEMLHVDELKLYQIFTNLIGNAIKFTESGYVKVDVSIISGKANSCKFSANISDSGIGIAPKSQKAIFDQFTQIENTISQPVRGTGLGLAITKSLVELLGGDLKLESTLGVGSSFSFDFEVQKAKGDAEEINDQAEIIQMPTHVSKLAANPLTILMVDDDPVNCLLFQRIFQKEGHKVNVVTSGQTALELVDKNQYDLIVLDRQMPDMDGFETCSRIRAIDQENNKRPVPIVIYTADAQQEFHSVAKKVGANKLIVKGCSKKALFQALDEVMRERA